MTLDQVLSALVYLLAVFALFFIGKVVYDRLHRQFNLSDELVKKDNFALALAGVGYYLGLGIALGGVLEGESSG